MPDKLLLINDNKFQRSVAKNDAELKRGIAMFLFGQGALVALLKPKLAAIDAVVHGTKSSNRFPRRESATVQL